MANEKSPAGAAPTSSTGSPSAAPPPAASDRSAGRGRPRWKRWLFTGGISFVVLAVVAGAGLGGAEYYTSQPSFCGTCHVMDPYYTSWSHDPHGSKWGVKCVDCHYAPGEQHTIRAKFRGLSQVASYFSGRYGAGRPRAQVSDDSCLRSNCHGDHAFSPKMLAIGEPRVETRLVGGVESEVHRAPSVHFVHEKHLNIEAKQAEVEADIKAVRARLDGVLSDSARPEIEAAIASIKPAAERQASLKALAAKLGLSDSARADAEKLMELEHRRVRVDQLSGLNCSACHAFNPTLETHIAADRQVCFTCHFTHEQFNQQTGECLRCHEAPTRSVRIHDTVANQASPSVVMDHQDIVRRGVECASCHLDVVRGDAPVSERECVHCHDQSHFLAEFATRTTETVRKYHAAHIAQQRAHCFDCHKAVQHGLLAAGTELATSGGFLEPVLNECRYCHPNHHSEQVALLTGSGGADVAHATPNAMIGSRLNCRACHTVEGAGKKGEALIRASEESCVACHGSDYERLFAQWKHEIETYLTEAEATLARVTMAVEARQSTGAPIAPELRAMLEKARNNVGLVRHGGGLHNRPFALQLLDSARRDLASAEAMLTPPREE